MKRIKIILSAVIVMIGMCVSAQWNTNGTHIYNTNTGFVGIGNGSIFTPTENLHIKMTSGAANIAIESAYESGNQVIGRYRIRNSTTNDMYYIGLRTWEGYREAIQSTYDGVNNRWLEFAYVNIDTRKYELRNGILDVEYKNQGNILFNNDGSIGIGTNEIPTETKLAVNGKIVCKEVEVTLDGWADDVFYDNYNLKSLGELELFIKKNKQLPGIPSEKEVLEKGIKVGEMNALLLRKIEELTLYVIELKNENDKLKEKMNCFVKNH
jgi:hypothetical protein